MATDAWADAVAKHEAALAVGARVRVRLNGECHIHAHPYALREANGEIGTIVDDMRAPRWDWPPFGEGWPGRLNAAEHWWAVRFDHVMRWHDGSAADADRYCAAELIPEHAPTGPERGEE